MPNFEDTAIGLLTNILSALRSGPAPRPVVAAAEKITGPSSFIIPSNTKAFTIVNLGENEEASVFDDVAITGIDSISAIPQKLTTFSFSIENDQNYFINEITVTPAADHVVLILMIKNGNIS